MDHMSSLDGLRSVLQMHVFEFLLAAFVAGVLVGALTLRKKFRKE